VESPQHDEELEVEEYIVGLIQRVVDCRLVAVVLYLIDLPGLAAVRLAETLLTRHLHVVHVLAHEIRLQESYYLPLFLLYASLLLLLRVLLRLLPHL
jgi:hypothetical protein